MDSGFWFEAGALGTNAIVGGGVPMGAGNAWAQKHSGTDDLTISYFGDGSSQIGSVLESMNLAAAWKLPFCFFIENNLYAVSTRVDEISADPRLSVRGPASWTSPSDDPVAISSSRRTTSAESTGWNSTSMTSATPSVVNHSMASASMTSLQM